MEIEVYDFIASNDYKNYKKAFANSLKRIMKFTKTNPNYLSKKIEIPQQTIYRYSIGENEPTISQAIKICNFFFLTLNSFINCGIFENEEINIEDMFLYKIASAENQSEIINAVKNNFPKFMIEDYVK